MNHFFQKRKQNQEYDITREGKQKLDIMLEAALPTTFSNQIWQTISKVSASQFIMNQEDIKNILLNDQKLFQTFFPKFYKNHQHLSHWYMLANANQLEIKKYVFHSLLQKTYREYRDLIRDWFPDSRYNKTCENSFQEEKRQKQKKGQSFHKITVDNNRSSVSPKKEEKSKWEAQISPQKSENEYEDLVREDYHQLFLKTFNACDGSKYIYYDFHKHMRGVEDKKKYNEFIRIKKHKKSKSNLPDFGQLSLQALQGFTKSAHPSAHCKHINNLYHLGQQNLQSMKYSSFAMNPIGQIEKIKYVRELMWLRKTAGGLKKVKSSQTPFRFQLKRKKIL